MAENSSEVLGLRISKKGITKVQATILLVLIVVVVGAVGYYYSVPRAPEVKEIKIGLLYPLTGPLATLGTEECDASKMAIDMINERGGIKGYKVSYVVADAKSDPKVAASEAERLCTIEKVPIIVGTYSSALLLAASEVAEKYKTIYWEVGAITEQATLRGYKYLFRPEIIGSDYGYISAKFVVEKIAPAIGLKPSEIRVAIIHEDGPYGVSVADGNEFMCKKEGLNVVLKEGYSTKATDLSYLILKLIAEKPHVIMATSYFTDAALIFRQAKELGLKVKAFIGHSAGYADPATYKTLGEDITYVFNVGVTTCWINPDALLPEVGKILKEYIDRWQKKFGKDPLVEAMIAFGHTWLLMTDILPRTIEKYGAVNAENVRKAAYETNVPEGGTILGWGVRFSTPEKPEDTDIGKIIRADKPQLHVNQNVKTFPVVAQWYPGGKLVVVWPDKFAYKPAVIPLPPQSPYAG